MPLQRRFFLLIPLLIAFQISMASRTLKKDVPYQDLKVVFIGVVSTGKVLSATVGAVWKMYFDQTNEYSYFGADGFHPTLKGSKRAAKAISKTICKQSAVYGNKD